MVPYLEMGGFNVFLSRKLWFHSFSVQELKVQKDPYLEMGGSNVSCLGTEGSKGDRKSVVQGKSVDLGGRRIIKKKKYKKK